MPTPMRTVRIDDDRWHRITAHAAATETTASDVIRDAIDQYIPHTEEPAA